MAITGPGCTDTSVCIPVLPVSLSEPTGPDIWVGALTPNPSSDGWVELPVSVPVSLPLQWTVFDVAGRPVAQERRVITPGQGVVVLDMSALSSGSYLVRLAWEGHVTYRKLVRE